MGPQGSRGKRRNVPEILGNSTHRTRTQKVKEQCSRRLPKFQGLMNAKLYNLCWLGTWHALCREGGIIAVMTCAQ